MVEQRTFDFKTQINKLNTVFSGKTSTVLMAESVYDAVFSVAEKSSNKKYEIVCFENDYIRYGASITEALKKAKAEYSLYLINSDEISFKKPEEIFAIKNSEIIVMGSKELISYVLFYASNIAVCHAVLTRPYSEGLLGGKVTVPDGGFFKSIEVNTLKTLILDKNVINKASGKSVAYAYIKTIGKLITLIDYKFSLLIGDKKIDNEHFDRSRLAVTLASMLNTFKNPVEVLTYSSLLLAEVGAASDVLTGGSHENVAHALELMIDGGDKSIISYVAFDRCAKLYHAFFVNDLTDIISVADYNGEIALLSKISGKSREYFLSMLKIPGEKRRKLLAKLVNITRSGFLKETSELVKALPNVKKTFLEFSKEKESALNFKYALIKDGITLAPYLTERQSVLTLMRDFGILNLAK